MIQVALWATRYPPGTKNTGYPAQNLMKVSQKIFELNRTPPDPCAEIDPNLHLLETRLFMIAQQESYDDVVSIQHPRGLRALRRMTHGEIQQIASAVCASFRVNADISAFIDNMPMQSVSEFCPLQEISAASANGKEMLASDFLLTLRNLGEKAPSPDLMQAKTGLCEDDTDALVSTTFPALRDAAKAIVDSCEKNGKPLFELRYDPSLLVIASRNPQSFSEMRLAQLVTTQPL
ncbi:hypothetical protein [Vreelandella massiliensis]|uniref:hypothetical protein n=1 Tax=Vreelandella massiliensis TaxID=1816686 RepID=UPI00096A397C|nr:hypothetical protein [Halomonas massiliensis]